VPGAAALGSPAGGEGAAEVKSSPLFKGSLPDAVRAAPQDKSRRPKPTMVVGETMGQSFLTVEAGLVLGGVGLDLQQEGSGPVYVAGKRGGGPAASCREIITGHGVELGEIQDDDVLLTIDGNPVKMGVNSDATLKAVRKGILGPPGTVVTLQFERQVDTSAVPFRYHVKLTRVAPKQETSSLEHSQREQDLERENAYLKAEVARLQARVDFLVANVTALENNLSEARARAAAAEGLLRKKAEEEAAVRELFKHETDEAKLMRMKLLLGVVMKKWFMRSLAKAFNPWAEATFERQHLRQLEIKAVRHWQHRGLSPAWERWCEFRAQRKRIKSKTKIVVLRWARKLEAKTLQSWWLAVLKRRRAVKAAKMWVNRALSRSWNSWYESHLQLQRINGKTKNVVLRWARQLEAKALQSWWIDVIKRRRAVKAATMWVNRALSRSWNSWYESHLQLQQQRNLAAKAASRWKHRSFSRVWVTWYEEHLQLRRLQNLSLRAIKMWKERALCKGVAKWWIEVLRTRKARKAAAMWTNSCLTRALHQWIHNVSEANRLRLTAEKVVRRWRNQAFAKSWGAWYSWHLYLRNLFRVAKTVILRWMHGVKSKCFQKWWLDHVVRVRIVTRVLARMKSRFVAKAWSKWCYEVVRSRRLSRVVLHWAQRKQSLAFVAWDAYVRESKHAGIGKPRRLIEHTIKQWQNKVLSAAWNSWILEVKQAARRRQMLSNATLKWLNRALAQAMEKWRHEVVRKRKALKAVARWTHGVRPSLTKL
jgi:hypothetical protein